MNFKIVADSSANIFTLEGVPFESVPLKIVTREKEYRDDPDLDVAEMVEEIKKQTGRSGSSCPNIHEWTGAFGEAEQVFVVTITGGLSGAHSSAVQAAGEYMAEHPGRRVCVIDSLSTGPEMQLIIEKIRSGILAGHSFEQIEQDARAYCRRTHLIFTLKSLTNLARNGRVSPAVAALAGALGIWVVGRASAEGTLEQRHKCRGEKKALKAIINEMKDLGFAGGRVIIDHCMNPEIAGQLRSGILQEYPACDVRIGTCKGLCSFYAERGGFMLGFECE